MSREEQGECSWNFPANCPEQEGVICWLVKSLFCVCFQTISALEAQLSNLRDELQAAHTQHRQHLAELAAIGDKEKQRAFLDKEAALNRLRSDMERIRSDLERSHRQERDATEEKVGNRGQRPGRQWAGYIMAENVSEGSRDVTTS